MKKDSDADFDMFTKCLMISVFVGISAVFINLAFDQFFRRYTSYDLASLINVSSIIMGCMIVLVFCGVFYYLFRHYLKGAGSVLYSIVFIALTAFLIWKANGMVRSSIPVKNMDSMNC